MTTTEGNVLELNAHISELQGQANEVRQQVGDLREVVGELRGDVNGLNKRMDDNHRLLMVLVGIAGGGLLTAVVGVVLQLIK